MHAYRSSCVHIRWGPFSRAQKLVHEKREMIVNEKVAKFKEFVMDKWKARKTLADILDCRERLSDIENVR